MTPAARLQAAVELLETVDRGASAAVTRRRYFAGRRYAGAKDRRAIDDLLHETVRRRAEIDWRLRDPGSARLHVMTAALLIGLHDLDALAGLCGSGPYAPPPLSSEERGLLAAAVSTTGELPDWAAANVPRWLTESFRRRFGNALVQEAAALNERAPVDLRVNTLLGRREQLLTRLRRDGLPAEPTPLSPLGLRLPVGSRMEDHPALRGGRLELQDESSQLAALLVDARPGMQVLDFCAGAGGKSLALAAVMQNSGQIYATDRDARRLSRIKPRLDRAKVRNVQFRAVIDGDGWLAALAGRMDRVLVDAPCSGSGAWRRRPETRWQLTPEGLVGMTERQDDLLDAAAEMVRAGGRLIYCTCSVLPEENEDRIGAFFDRTDGFRLLPIDEVWCRAVSETPPQTGNCLQLTPLQHGCDGFFIAVLEREAGAAGGE